MKLLTVGDSFTYGEELEDLNNSWPHLLGQKIGYDVLNLGARGSGNTQMIRNVVEQVILDKPDLIVVAWTSAGRIEFSDEDGVYDTWPGYSGRMFFNQQPWREQLVRYVNEHHNDQHLYKQFLINCILLQDFLKLHQIPYVMLQVLPDDYYSNVAKHYNTNLLSKLDLRNYVDGNESGMMEWTYGCAKGPNGHFLEQGHEKVANKIYEHIRHLGWLS
jgi:hypothetical protein